MEYRTLPVSLTEEEIKQKGDVLATRIEERDAIELRRKAAADGFKEELKAISGDINSLARQVRTREEQRVVKCLWERDDSRMSMILVRQDTGEIFESRAMRDDERQTALFSGETPQPAAESAE
jgi:hypothetical protein